MRIEFYLRYRTQLGQNLSIVGNLFTLGDNKVEQALPMRYYNSDFWHVSIEVEQNDHNFIHYQYLLTTEKKEIIKEGEKRRQLNLAGAEGESMIVVDTWNYAGEYENVFFTTPFKNVFFDFKQAPKTKKAKDYTHIFKVKAPLLQASECVCLLGEGDSLNHWNDKEPILLEKQGEWWVTKVDLTHALFPAAYKYGVYNYKKEELVRFESGENRYLAFHSPKSVTVLHDGFLRMPNYTWKGAGVAIPVFSLKSNSSFGVGEFCDIKLLVDWAVQTGLKLIQLLPVNDTSATFTAKDSYPYAAISAFALHPIYINVKRVAGKKYAGALKSVTKKQKQLNSLDSLDYEKVMHFKMQLLREVYTLQQEEFLEEDDYKPFLHSNGYWLKPYAAFCYFRDKYGTADFTQWKTNSVFNEEEINKLCHSKTKAAEEIRFYFFVQYHLHLQLKEITKYANRKGLILKGDIPIGIFRNSVDAWMAPDLYNMNWQAGAPPDDFAVKGQNWGFPTYNWQRMQENNFEWWRKRFEQMSHYFDAFRIDHILGFFRIWSIPLNAVEGILGRFVPALPVKRQEFLQRGISFDVDRFCKPYITDAVLNQVFSGEAETVKNTFLEPNNRGGYNLKEAYDTQRKVEAYFTAAEKADGQTRIKEGLFDLISNVILYEVPDSNGEEYHFRISIEHTTSFQHFDELTRYTLKELYTDYFYRRQDEFWKREALNKLPALKEATNMLICGEDLGMVPHSVPDVMKGLGILSLEIQRMPKNPQLEFFHPHAAPYLSVVTPSTHDMSTIRGWWEESREKTQRFYNTMLQSHGEAPPFCEPWINRAIVLQHLYSPAMWSIFQLQDLMGMNGVLRRDDPHEERINIPADPNHYWKYRMHIPLEQLLKEEDFNMELKEYIINSGR